MRNVALLMIILAGCTQTPKEAPKETTKETTEARIPNAEEIALKAYKQAYSHGHNRFMEQIGKTTKAWKYTSSEEEEITEEKLKGLKDEEREAVIEAMSRGYVDGYHSAGESTTCPSFR
jgi:DNA-directed RNA polymerase specialized sigma24 family protein